MDEIIPDENSLEFQQPQQVPITKDDMARTIKAFLEDERLDNFSEILNNFFSKHVMLSFLDDKDIGIMMLHFDSALTNYIIFNDEFSPEDLTKIDQIRMIFFAALKRAKGRRDNERELLAKIITENIQSLNSNPNSMPTGNRFKRWLFG